MTHTESSSGQLMIGCSENGTEFVNEFGPLSLGSVVRFGTKSPNESNVNLCAMTDVQIPSDPMLGKPAHEVSAVEFINPSSLFTIKNILRLTDLKLPSPLLEGNYFIKDSSMQELCLAVTESKGDITCSQRPFVYDKDFTSDFNWSLWWLDSPGHYIIRSASSNDECQNKRALSIDSDGVVSCTNGLHSTQEVFLKEMSDGTFLIRSSKGNFCVSIKTGVGSTGKAIKSTTNEAEATKFKFERKK
jgi:hypothetical protein